MLLSVNTIILSQSLNCSNFSEFQNYTSILTENRFQSICLYLKLSPPKKSCRVAVHYKNFLWKRGSIFIFKMSGSIKYKLKVCMKFHCS